MPSEMDIFEIADVSEEKYRMHVLNALKTLTITLENVQKEVKEIKVLSDRHQIVLFGVDGTTNGTYRKVNQLEIDLRNIVTRINDLPDIVVKLPLIERVVNRLTDNKVLDKVEELVKDKWIMQGKTAVLIAIAGSIISILTGVIVFVSKFMDK
jgi:hypothetical protein